ncbi:MAG: proton-conducting transporter membrane subunit [Blastocatellia bacterium]
MILPVVSFSVFMPLALCFVIWRRTSVEQARRWTAAALALSFAALLTASVAVARAPDARFTEIFWQWFVVDALNAIPLPLFTALVLGVAVAAPRRKLSPQWFAGLLWLSATTNAAYAANNLVIFVLGWAGSLAPFLFTRAFVRRSFPSDGNGAAADNSTAGKSALPLFARIVLSMSLVSLCIGAALLAYAAPRGTWRDALSLTVARTGDFQLLFIAFAFLMGAVVLRKGIFPAHFWVVTSFEQGSLLPMTLLVNGHLGAFLIARIVLPLLPDVAHSAWPLFSNLGLFTAAYAALLAFVARAPRRLFALLAISQSAFLLTGLESNTSVGIAGSLVLWQVVAVSITMLAAVYSGLEARLGAALENGGFLGLAVGAPRLAVFFAAGGLALVGLPLTLGFPAEDLLLQGTLAANPYLGVILPVVTALNAFSVVRLFARLFLGRPTAAAHDLADALPRERWVLTVAMLFLVMGGLFPAPLIKLPALAAERIVRLVSGSPDTPARRHD